MANKITRGIIPYIRQQLVDFISNNLQHNDNLQNNLTDSDSFPDSWR